MQRLMTNSKEPKWAKVYTHHQKTQKTQKRRIACFSIVQKLKTQNLRKVRNVLPIKSTLKFITQIYNERLLKSKEN